MSGVLLRTIGAAEWMTDASCKCAVVVMTVLVLLQVLLRYVFRAPLAWVEEATIFLMIWMTFAGSAIAFRRGLHISMTMLLVRLPARLYRSVMVVAHLATIGFFGVVAWQGIALTLSARGQVSSALAMPMVIPYLIMPIGAVVTILQVVAVLLELFLPPKQEAQRVAQ